MIVNVAEPRVDPRHALGRRGEDEAARLLRRAGYRILERRFRLRLGEIDLIAERGVLLVFVEVKTRGGRQFGEPAEAVTRAKRERLGRTALAYLAGKGWLDRPCRFDVVEVVVEAEAGFRTRHIEDAFRF